MTSDDEFGERLRERLEDLAGSAPPPAPPVALAPSWNRSRLIAAAAAVVLIAGAIAAYSRSSSPSRVRTSAPITTTTTTSSSDSTTTETTDTTPTTSEPPSTVPATVLSTTTTSASPPPDCTPDDLEATVASDKPAYAVGETVTITVSIRNRSDHSCVVQPPQRFSYTFGSPIKVTDPNGALIWRRGARGTGSMALIDPLTLAPGDSYMWATVQWDQHFCQGPCAQDYPGRQGSSSDSTWNEGAQVPAGSYRAQPADETPPPASTVTPASFELTP